jgi:hypothetical protein
MASVELRGNTFARHRSFGSGKFAFATCCIQVRDTASYVLGPLLISMCLVRLLLF